MTDSQMPFDHRPAAATNQPRWMTCTGRVISALPVLMIAMGFTVILFQPQAASDNNAKFGWADSSGRWLIPLELACVLLYCIPRTAVLGVILFTGYMGGAIATHARVGDPGWIIPAVLGIFGWLGLFLRDPRLRALLPLRSLK